MKTSPTPEQKDLLRQLPQVEDVLQTSLIVSLQNIVPRAIIADQVRACIDAARASILSVTEDSAAQIPIFPAKSDLQVPTIDDIANQSCQRILALCKPSLRKVINASGVVIHTNLGRSALAKPAVDAVVEVAQGYSTLEFDIEGLQRGSRHDHYEQLICALTGAEAAIAVNNNAAAVMMVLSEFAAHQEAIVSRGELVEIGGSFRVPDIMSLSQAKMVEIGTTNKTHKVDYENALTDETAMLLKVHPSNFRMIGFTESVSLADLRAIADKENGRRRGELPQDSAALLPAASSDVDTPEVATSVTPQVKGNSALELLVYEDQGSGALIAMDCFGTYAEPTVSESLKQGADLVSFSGDKLLGGPQAGIIVGKKALIDRLKTNPLARALRLDKMSLAALEATLRLYLDPEEAQRKIPTLVMLTASKEEVKPIALSLEIVLRQNIARDEAKVELVEEVARAGGGALPMCDIETYAVRIEFKKGNAQACEEFLAKKRDIPIIVRIKKDAIICDAITLLNEAELIEVGSAFKAYFASLQ